MPPQEQSIIPLASAHLGLVPRRHQSDVLDYGGSISSCGDRQVWSLLYEAANVMLTRHERLLKLKDWAIAAFFGASRPLPCVPAKDRTNGSTQPSRQGCPLSVYRLASINCHIFELGLGPAPG